ncbi:MAG: DUF4011 domain-containing protein [Chloroflexi bacterium]|nr:DUF4011 domain-containing protein [Chloroflexota bacterium]
MTKSEAPSPSDVLRYSVEAVKRGDVHIGKRGLIWVVQKEPSNVTAWLWLAYVIEDRKTKVECYTRVLRLDPANETAKKALAKYGPQAPELPAAPTAEAAPIDRTAISELARLEVSTETKESVASKLELARRDLLDLSLYNKLLNYRPLKAKGVEITDEKPEEVFRILVTEGRPMAFLPTKWTAPKGEGPLFASAGPEEEALEQPEEVEGPERFTDNKLQTPYPSEELQARLLNTYFAARTYIEEQGVNILFLALGMMRWFESEASDDVKLAPLILVPVELSRSNVRAKFRVRYTEEEIGENLSLRAKLATDFGLKLPEFPEEDELRIEPYFRQVAASIAAMRKWSVDHSAISLGFFSFGKFLMFHDLEQDEWPEKAQPADHPLLSRLLGDGFPPTGELLGDDTDIDQVLAPEDSLCVVDADSSQTIAILEVNKGRNLIIQGPPGTGKSQTITNLIAEGVGRHKSVLFVAEKMAALEVVKRRLDNIGLGDACLELHSHKANKKALLAELRRSLELGQPRQPPSIDIAELKRNRDRLNGYSRAVNEEIGASQLTPFEAYGRLLTLNEALAPTRPPNLHIPGIEEWARDRMEEALTVADEL